MSPMKWHLFKQFTLTKKNRIHYRFNHLSLDKSLAAEGHFAISAKMNRVLPAVHAKRDQTAPACASDTEQNYARYPLC